jgi:TonB family protein
MRFVVGTRRAACLVTLAGVVTSAPGVRARAQAAGGQSSAGDSLVAVTGFVRGPDGLGLVGAEVTITPKSTATNVVTLGRRIYTSDSGAFRIPSIPRGPATVAVRRIGFKPVSLDASLPAVEPLFILLDPGVQTLSAVVVKDRQRIYEGHLADFNRRRDMGFGRFITRSDIDARNAMRTSDMLRTIPGIQVTGNAMGSSISMRGAACQPLVWIDGTPALSGPLDVDIFSPFTLDGIEVYKGVSEVPVELRGPRGEERCGVIAIWSRMPERQPRKSKRKPVTAEELNKLIASATVYTADQVDQPARADSTVMLEPIYPDSLKAAHTSGTAIVEFVVDTEGRVETETISVVVASHPAFARAARDAAPSARFIPAVHQGRPVRQVVQLPVEFQASKLANGRKE